jgi:hypothetical protein
LIGAKNIADRRHRAQSLYGEIVPLSRGLVNERAGFQPSAVSPFCCHSGRSTPGGAAGWDPPLDLSKPAK